MNDLATIEFEHVDYQVPGGAVILDDVSFIVERGTVLVLVGRSGVGKTTILRLINRLLVPSAGIVRVEGRATPEWDPIALRRRTGYVLQEVGLFPHMTIGRNIAVVPAWKGGRRLVSMRDVGSCWSLSGLTQPPLKGGFPTSSQAANVNEWGSRGHWPPTPP